MHSYFACLHWSPAFARVWVVALVMLWGTSPAQAELPTIDALPTFDIGSVLPETTLTSLTKTLGFLTSHRSFHGATALGSPGFDLSVEASLVHLPTDFSFSTESGGSGAGDLGLPSLPIAKIHLHKSIGELLDIGVSGLYYPGLLLLGLEAKLLVFKPEDGLHWAIRMNYSSTSIDFKTLGFEGLPLKPDGETQVGTLNIGIRTRTLSPQLIASKRLSFAEPYAGVSVSWISGQIDIPINLNIESTTRTLSTSAYRSMGYELFTGVIFRVPHLPLMIAMEGGYSTLGMHHLGTNIGVSF